ncbi:MAG: gamma-glutamylcyclotransferase [Rhodobacteraceae bacterium]|nr:gamma-glutamylcyclotransferase [Paracoccaceae bacterium]
MKTYFAYGTLIGTEAMRELAPSAQPVGAMRLEGYELDFAATSREGTGGCWLRPAEGGEVWGMQYQMTDADRESMDAAAGIPERLWVNIPVTLTDLHGNRVETTTYTIPDNPPPHRPTPDYTDKIRNGLATAAGIPADYAASTNRRLDALHGKG